MNLKFGLLYQSFLLKTYFYVIKTLKKKNRTIYSIFGFFSAVKHKITLVLLFLEQARCVSHPGREQNYKRPQKNFKSQVIRI